MIKKREMEIRKTNADLTGKFIQRLFLLTLTGINFPASLFQLPFLIYLD